MGSKQRRLHFQRHRIGDQPPAGLQGLHGTLKHARFTAAATDENSIRLRQAFKSRRGRADHDLKSRNAESFSIAGDTLGPFRVLLYSDCTERRMGQHPFYADRTRTGTDIPQQLAPPWGKRRKCHGADFTLGDLPVMFEQAIIKPTCERQNARTFIRHDVNRYHVQRINISKCEISRPDLPPPLPLSTQGFKQDEFRLAETQIGQQFRDQGRGVGIRGERDDACAGMKIRPQEIDGAPM